MVKQDIKIQTYSLLKRFKNKKCEKCEKFFVLNDTIHTTTARKIGKRYHIECWESSYH